MGDLRDRVPGHALIDELLRQWDQKVIRFDEATQRVVIDEEARSWYQGVLGERRVGARLAALSDGYRVLHSVPVGPRGADIDHLVVSRVGVWTINTKYSPGKKIWVAGTTLLVGGQRQPYIHRSLLEADRAAERISRASGLTVPVTAMLAFVDPAGIAIRDQPGAGPYRPRIEVIDERGLLERLGGAPQFSQEQFERIVAAACDASTWTADSSVLSSARAVRREFEALEAEVGHLLVSPPTAGAAAPTKAQRNASTSSTRTGLPRTPRPVREARRKRTVPRRRPHRAAAALVELALKLGGLWLVYQLFMAILGQVVTTP